MASDQVLIDAVQGGSVGAFEVLYDRYRSVALAGARSHLAPHNRSHAEDVVEITFASIYGAMRRGGGPRGPFRSYLLLSIRREAARQQHRRRREAVLEHHTLDRLSRAPSHLVHAPRHSDELLADGVVGSPSREGDLDPHLLLGEVFKGLNDRFRHALWLSEVEGRSPEEIAPMFGVSPNAAAAVCYRARRALRSGYFGAYASTLAAPACKPLVPKLATFVEAGQPAEGHDSVRAHLAACSTCRDVARGSVRSGSVLGALAPFGLLSSGAWLDPDHSVGASRRVRHNRVVQAAAVVGLVLAMVGAAVWSIGSGPGDPQEVGQGPGDPTEVPSTTTEPPDRSSPRTGPGPAAPGAPTTSTTTTTPAPLDVVPGQAPPDGGTPDHQPFGADPGSGAAGSTSTSDGAPKGAIRGRLAADRDGAGPGAPTGSQGTPVRVVRPDGGEVARVLADQSGRFRVDGLVPGPYRVLASLPVGMVVAGDANPSGSASSRREVPVADTVVQPAGEAPVDALFVPWRRLAIRGGANSASTVGPGGEVSWTFELSSGRAPTTDAVLDVAVDHPAGAELAVVLEGAPAGSCPVTGGTGSALTARCQLGTLSGAATVITVRVRVRSASQRGYVTPRLTVGASATAAETASAAGRPVSLQP